MEREEEEAGWLKNRLVGIIGSTRREGREQNLACNANLVLQRVAAAQSVQTGHLLSHKPLRVMTRCWSVFGKARKSSEKME